MKRFNLLYEDACVEDIARA